MSEWTEMNIAVAVFIDTLIFLVWLGGKLMPIFTNWAQKP